MQRRALPRPPGGTAYELTAFGRDLEEIVLALGRWGARTLAEPRPDEIVTLLSLIMAMRSTFDRAAAAGVHAGFELRLGPVVIHLRVDDGALDAGEGSLPAADLVIETGPAIKALMAREMTPADAIAAGAVVLTGDSALLERFVAMFPLDSAPAPAA